MKVDGNVTTFEYVRHYNGEPFRYNQQIAVVACEGELETWIVQDGCLSTVYAVQELREYYKQDVSVAICYPAAIFSPKEDKP